MSIETIAIVDATTDGFAVWWVRSSAGDMDRMCGAWVLPSERLAVVPGLLAGRGVIATRSGSRIVRESGSGRHHVIDPTALCDAVAAAAEQVRAEYDKANAGRSASRALVPPTLPTLPSTIDVEHPSLRTRLPDAPRALLIARQVEAWCLAWDHIEEARLCRPYLRVALGQTARALPVPVDRTAAVTAA